MGLLSFMEDLPPPDAYTIYTSSYVGFIFAAVMILYRFSIAGRPVAHPGRGVVRKHKKAEADRVEALERLNSGSKSVDSQVNAVSPESVDVCTELSSDVEKDPLCRPLLTKSDKEEHLVTISLSTSVHGFRLASCAYDVMKNVSEEAAASGGEFADDSFICSSDGMVFQSKVVLREGILERLKELVKDTCLVKQLKPPPKDFVSTDSNLVNEQLGPSPPKESIPVLQVDSWAILKPSDQGVDFLRLPVDEVPVITHAEYAAGILTITGLNLQDAKLYLSAENATYSMTLDVWRFAKGTYLNVTGDSREDILSVPVQLSWKSIKDCFIYATKNVNLGGDGQSVDAVSKAVRIVDSFCNTVLGLWVPTIAMWILIVHIVCKIPYSLVQPISSIVSFHFFIMWWILILFTKPSKRLVDFIKYHSETVLGGLGRGLLLFNHGLKGLNGPEVILSKYLPRRNASQPNPGSKGSGLHLEVNANSRKSSPPACVISATSRAEAATGKSFTSVRSRARPAQSEYVAQGKWSEDAASVQSVDDPNWEWPAFEEFVDKTGKTSLKRPSEEITDKVSPFRVVYRRKKALLWPDEVRIDLFSSTLIQIVQKLLPSNGDLQCLENPKIQARDLFLQLDGLRNPVVHSATVTVHDPSHERSRDGSEVAGKDKPDASELHSKHLIRFFDREFADVVVRQRRMNQEKRVAWDMLWTFLAPGKKVVYNCDHSQELLAAIVSRNSYEMTTRGEWLFSIDLEIWDYDGTSYRKCQINRTIKSFDGEREFCGLAVRPIDMQGVPEILDEGFLGNGKRFQELAMKSKHRFMQYTGAMFQVKSLRGSFELAKKHADGRVMIDLGSFAKMNPGYYMGTAKPPVAYGYGPMMLDFVDGRRSGRTIREQNGPQFCPVTTAADVDVVSDESLIFAPAIVYGFSFTLREWGSFDVSGFSEISFHTDAFDGLVMEADRKQLVYDLVSQYIASPMDAAVQHISQFDPISHKGEGCIFLCYGPPGTGKTLTAESLAERMHRPLWSLTVSELGVAPNELEQTLFKILDIAATWRAVLLLDEADVFLERRRSSQNLTRNAMTGVFLRFLEYYRGVLFLTTNRVEIFDNAVRSRVSMFLHYPQLTSEHKEQVWKTILDRAGVTDVTAEFIAQMAADNLNGREIRNVIHTAQIWAKSKGQALGRDHVSYTKSVFVRSLRTLSDTIKASVKADDHDGEEV